MKLRSGDEVLVLQGKDKGRKGSIEKLFAKKGSKKYINNLRKRIKKPLTMIMAKNIFCEGYLSEIIPPI